MDLTMEWWTGHLREQLGLREDEPLVVVAVRSTAHGGECDYLVPTRHGDDTVTATLVVS